MKVKNQMPQIVQGVFSEKNLSILKKQSITDTVKGGELRCLVKFPL